MGKKTFRAGLCHLSRCIPIKSWSAELRKSYNVLIQMKTHGVSSIVLLGTYVYLQKKRKEAFL